MEAQFYTFLFKDRTTKQTHAVVTSIKNYRRTDRSRALCVAKISPEIAWARPPGGDPITCTKCLDAHTAMSDLIDAD